MSLQGEPESLLSESAKIGIGVGIPIFVILMVTFALVWWRRRKRRSEDHKNEGVHEVHEVEDTSNSKGLAGIWSRAELDNTQQDRQAISELEDTVSTSKMQRGV